MAGIAIRGAREHNLRAVDLDLPRDRLIVFCGVSGSGKSSLAFDTLFVEGQRRYLEALAVHRSRGPSLVPPRVDRIDGLPPTIALAQRAGAPGPRATVGSVAEVDPVLRILFARAGVQHCPRCDRPIVPRTLDEIVGALLALPDGARLTLEVPLRIGEQPIRAVLKEIERAGFSRVRAGGEVIRIDELRPGTAPERIVVDRIRLGPDRRSRVHDSVRLATRAGRGVVIAATDDGEQTFVDRPYCFHDDLLLPALEPRSLWSGSPPGACPICEGAGLSDDSPCGGCGGSRLSEAARAVRWNGTALPRLLSTPIQDLGALLRVADPEPIEALTVPELMRRLDRLVGLGLGQTTLGRAADRLSSSELQRIRLIRQVSSPLSGVLYVLDEPTAGLDPALIGRVVALLRELVDAGNTVIAVEHAQEVILAADHVVEFGPGAGVDGGRVIHQGPPEGLLDSDTPTGRWLSGRERLLPRSAEPRGWVRVRGDWLRGAPGPEIRLARGAVTAITGEAGSGKSALLETLGASLSGLSPPGVELIGAEGLTRPIVADRGAARASRSNPATYVGLWDTLRELLASTRDAQVRGLGAAAFSLNTTGGRCEACKGTGERIVELGPLPDVVQICPVCEGRRFQQEVLEVRWKGMSAAELLELPADQARPLLAGHPRLDDGLQALIRVGLGYVPLGQPVHSLSGGEARRLTLARELGRAQRRGAEDTVHLLDDPTVGLHPRDTALLVGLLRELCNEGATVWAATVDPVLLGVADQVVEISTGTCG